MSVNQQIRAVWQRVFVLWLHERLGFLESLLDARADLWTTFDFATDTSHVVAITHILFNAWTNRLFSLVSPVIFEAPLDEAFGSPNQGRITALFIDIAAAAAVLTATENFDSWPHVEFRCNLFALLIDR